MKFGVVIFPGSNCDEDIIHVLRDVMGQEVVRLWHKDTDLQAVDFVILPGGFSFGDYLRSGAIARFSPVMEEVIRFAARGGYVMGICNGFQILAEAGLVPGALLHNDTRKFICNNFYIRPANTNTLLTSSLEMGKALKIPIAHGEGRYFASEDVIKELNDNDQVLFHYCDQFGEISPESNPNGSIQNIAGVCNRARNVFGMMPHPERAADNLLGNQDGCGIFDSILKTIHA